MMRAIEQIQERADSAGDHVAKLCTKEDRWTMSVPPRSTDSDVLLTQITDHDVPAMAAALQAVLDIAEHAGSKGAYEPNLDEAVTAIHYYIGNQYE